MMSLRAIATLTLLTILALTLPAGVRAQGALPGQAVDVVTLPSVIPLFPLPDVVLFPGMSRPLYIFEPRYREMIADALKGDRIIGMVLLRPGFEKDYEGRPPIHEIGCAGEIAEYELLPDGRYTIVLRGLTKFRVVTEDQRRAYRQARVELMPETVRNEDLAPLSAVRERLFALLVATLPPDVEPPGPTLSDTEFVNVTAQFLDMPESVRQDLLERGSVLLRARGLVEFLERR